MFELGLTCQFSLKKNVDVFEREPAIQQQSQSMSQQERRVEAVIGQIQLFKDRAIRKALSLACGVLKQIGMPEITEVGMRAMITAQISKQPQSQYLSEHEKKEDKEAEKFERFKHSPQGLGTLMKQLDARESPIQYQRYGDQSKREGVLQRTDKPERGFQEEEALVTSQRKSSKSQGSQKARNLRDSLLRASRDPSTIKLLEAKDGAKERLKFMERMTEVDKHNPSRPYNKAEGKIIYKQLVPAERREIERKLAVPSTLSIDCVGKKLAFTILEEGDMEILVEDTNLWKKCIIMDVNGSIKAVYQKPMSSEICQEKREPVFKGQPLANEIKYKKRFQ